MSRFSDMLTFLRKRENLSQQELAEKLGCAKSTISMYENGKREPDFETLEAIADTFNVSMSVLIDPKSLKKIIPDYGLQFFAEKDYVDPAQQERDKRMLAAFRLLPAEYQEFLIAQTEGARQNRKDQDSP